MYKSCGKLFISKYVLSKLVTLYIWDWTLMGLFFCTKNAKNGFEENDSMKGLVSGFFTSKDSWVSCL